MRHFIYPIVLLTAGLLMTQILAIENCAVYMVVFANIGYLFGLY